MHMLFSSVFAVLLLISLNFLLFVKGDIEIVGYVPDYRVRSLDVDYTFSKATDIILFSVEPSIDPQNKETMMNGFNNGRIPPPKEVLDRMLAAKEKYGTRLLVGIGGAGRSSAFSAVLMDRHLRQKFVNALIDKILIPYKLDGFDINVSLYHYYCCPCN